MLPEWLQNIINAATSTTVTGGSLAVLTYLLLASGRLFTRGQWDRQNAEHDSIIKRQDEAHDARVLDLIKFKDQSIELMQTQLKQAITDRDALRDALDLERGAKDKITSKVIDEIVPLVQVTNKHLEGIEKLAEGGDQSG